MANPRIGGPVPGRPYSRNRMIQILDQNGDPVESNPEPHRFGTFRVPESAHIKFGDKEEKPYAFEPNMYAWVEKEHIRIRM